eukprot:6257800-Pyramimonas_sp.AAC.1
MDFNGTLAEAKRGPRQKIIAGLFVNMATAVLALTCDAAPRDDVPDIDEQGHCDGEASCHNVFGARSGKRLDPAVVRRGRGEGRRQMEESQ